MKQIFAFESKEEFGIYEDLIQRCEKKIVEYQFILEDQFELNDLPKGIVWTSSNLARTVFSTVPIPAYTNQNLIYFSPDLESWRALLIQQLEGKDEPEIQYFYENFSENQLFAIVGHELTHHLDLFLDDFDDNREEGIWFEEGMCEYLSRKYLLDENEFRAISNIERKLVSIFNNPYGNHSLEEFGSASYEGTLTSIMYDYWRSFLAVKFLVDEKMNGDIHQVFSKYHQWHHGERAVSLMAYFEIEGLFD